MGVKFEDLNGRRVELVLSKHIMKECEQFIENLKTFKANIVPRKQIMNFVMYLLVPKNNYGAFIDHESEREDYKEIDNKVYTFMKELLFNIPSIE